MAKTPPRRRMPTEEYTVTIHRDAETGMVVSERWEKDGVAHREGAPALIYRDAVTGIVVDEIWYRNNNPHRDEGPAQISRKSDTGRVYYTAWYKDGVKIKPPPRAERPTATPRSPSPKPR